MLRIIEHRSALPNCGIVEVHVCRNAAADPAIFATVAVTVFGQSPDPDAFPQPLPVADAFLQAISYAMRAGITVIWLDDPGGHFPPNKRPVIDVGER